MGLVAPLSTGGIPKVAESGDNLITVKDISTAVRDTFINRTAISPETYPDIFGSLLQYSTGTPVIVEYFRKSASYINNQTIDTSFSLERAAVHSSFDLIHNFEIRMQDQLEIKIDQETTETSIIGSAIVYPGLKPNVGDIFYLKLPDNNIGVFNVNQTEPMSIHRGTNYKIDFHLDGMLDDVSDAKIRESVSEELWFDKQSYFGSEVGLLTDTSYNQLSDLTRYRKAIISRLMNQFYNTTEKSLIRPDNVYDPYLIEYLSNKISINDNKRDLCQIANPYTHFFTNTIWETYLNQDVSNLMYTGYTLNKYQMYLFDAGMSNVDQFKLVSLIDPKLPFDVTRLTQAKFNDTDLNFKRVNYIFSDRFYYALLTSFEQAAVVKDIVPLLSDMITDPRIFPNLNDTFYSVSDGKYHDIAFFDSLSKMTGSNNDVHLPEIEYLVYDFILNNNIDVEYMITKLLVKFPFNEMTELDQLYNISILLNLIDASLVRLR